MTVFDYSTEQKIYVDKNSQIGLFISAFGMFESKRLISTLGGKRINIEKLIKISGSRAVSKVYGHDAQAVNVPTLPKFNNMLRLSEAKKMLINGAPFSLIFRKTGVYESALIQKNSGLSLLIV